MAIVMAGLGSAPIRRLHRTWEGVSKIHMEMFKQMDTILESKVGGASCLVGGVSCFVGTQYAKIHTHTHHTHHTHTCTVQLQELQGQAQHHAHTCRALHWRLPQRPNIHRRRQPGLHPWRPHQPSQATAGEPTNPVLQDAISGHQIFIL